jgi:hypothetical protein
MADHYFGPSLKWFVDLLEMLRRWRPAHERLAEQARAWRCRTVLCLALEHVDRLWPGAAPEDTRARLAPVAWRRRLLEKYRSGGPLELFAVPDGPLARGLLRCLMLDRPADALALTARVLLRPLLRPIGRIWGRALPPWEWRD